MVEQRSEWIDYTKAFGIMLVVYAHVARGLYHAGIAIPRTFFEITDSVIYSFVMPQYPPLPFLQYPYVVALIELDEGVRIVSNLCDIDPGDIEVGMPVEVFYETFEALPNGDELVLHQFRPAR